MLKKIGVYGIFLVSGLVLGYIFFMPKNDVLEPAVSSHSDNVGRWTCSMHPKINGKENGTCPLCNMDLVYMDTQMSDGVSESQFKMTKEAVALANIQTSKVSFADTENSSISLSGIITTNKETDAVQTTLFDGRIDALYANSVGRKVRKGQQIGLVYSPELYSAQDKLLTSASYKQTHQKLYDAARYTLGLWKMTDVQIDAMLTTGKPMMNFPLYADVTGTIIEVVAAEGNYYSKGDPLFKISDLNSVWAIFDAYESQLNVLKVGQEVEISLLSLRNQRIKAKISFIEPILNEVKRTVPIRVVIDNRNGLLKPGMLVEAKVKIDNTEEPLISIPKSAVLWTGKRSVVYTKPLENQSIFEMTVVELGQQLGNKYEVLSGLKIGDEIVTEGTFTIDAAAQLRGKKSMMSNHHVGAHAVIDVKETLKNMRDMVGGMNSNSVSQTSFTQLLDGYIALKDAFVATNIISAQQRAKELLDGLNTAIIQKGKSENSQLTAGIKINLEKIMATGDMVRQRKAFKFLSEEMLKLISANKAHDSTIYVQHCDCADNFSGGTWLSYQEQIKNPYFGDEMLTCGRVVTVLD